MNELVFLKKDDAFTNSMVIADGTGIEHRKIKDAIRKHKNQMETFGKLSAPCKAESTGGRPEEYFVLNETQATFLVTLLKNTETVVKFKAELVRQFYEMRKFIAERHTAVWVETRQQGKVTRNEETSVIKQLVEYAKEQGSNHADMLYVTYTRLANKMAGIENGRDQATTYQLNNLDLCENVILHIIRAGIAECLHYKEIYQRCKARLGTIRELAYLEARA